MPPEAQNQPDDQAAKIDAILKSVKKTEMYFKVTLWVTVIMFVLPLIGLLFVVPMVISTYTGALEGLI